MSVLQTIGFIWLIFTSALGSFGVCYAVYCTARNAHRQYLRGQLEESLDIKKCVEEKFLERMAR